MNYVAATSDRSRVFEAGSLSLSRQRSTVRSKSYAFFSEATTKGRQATPRKERLVCASGRLVVVALGFVIGSRSTAHALNFCFNPGVTGAFHARLAVAQKFASRTTATAARSPALTSDPPIFAPSLGPRASIQPVTRCNVEYVSTS
jgi:hypothetical protein